jgi:hypothetical protein
MNVVYLLQTHRDPEQIYRLVQTLRSSSNAFILIRHNREGCDLSTVPLQSLSNVAVACVEVGGARGRFSLEQIYLDAIEWLFQQKIEFDWLINLTGQDYPIQPLSTIKDFLANTNYDGFIEYFDAFAKQNNPWGVREGSDRYLYNYSWLSDELAPWQRALINPIRVLVNRSQSSFRINSSYGLGIGMRDSSPPFNQAFRCYGGSALKTLSWQCVNYIHQFARNHPETIEFFSKTCLPSEAMIQSILVNSGQFNLCNDDKRFIRWDGSHHGRPGTLTLQDYEAILNSESHFARKFVASTSGQLLELLDEKVLGQPTNLLVESNAPNVCANVETSLSGF